MTRATLLGTIAATLTAAAAYRALRRNSWLAPMVIRRLVDAEAWRVAAALRRHVPDGVAEQLNVRYAEGEEDATLDVFYPAESERSGTPLSTIVWVHGGGWLSGSKEQIANYARILAGSGHTVVSVNYSVAPEHRHPTPVRQLNRALDFLSRHAARLHVDPAHFTLAGDSSGANIVAQLANVLSSPSYARSLGIVPSIARGQLRGVVLYCGGYDMATINLDGRYGWFMKVMLRSYSGTCEYARDRNFALASVINYVSSTFPPTFISAGNADPLLAQSQALAAALTRMGVPVEALFFPTEHRPEVPHEYQFNLDSEAGRYALRRSLSFIAVEQARGLEDLRRFSSITFQSPPSHQRDP